jgi:hypothetical protein
MTKLPTSSVSSPWMRSSARSISEKISVAWLSSSRPVLVSVTPLTAAEEQLGPELLLQVAHRDRERRLAEPQIARGGRHAPALRDHLKIAEVGEIHGPIVSVYGTDKSTPVSKRGASG